MTTSATPPVAEAAPEPPRVQKRKESKEGGATGGAGWFTYAALGFIVLLWVLPTIGILLTSFRSRDDAASGGWWELFLKPSGFADMTFENYQKAIQGTNLGEGFVNSLAIALPATFIPILVAAFAAYAFAFMKFPGRDVLFVVIVGMLVVPSFVSFVPMLKIYRDLGIGGTFPAVWLFHLGFGMSLAIFMIRNYMATLPMTIIESAKIDGASHFQTFFRLVLPMSVPVLASFAIFQFLWVWNDLLVALVFLGPGDKAPMTVSISQLLGQQGQNQELVTASGMFSMLLPLIVFLSLQRFFVRGLTAGAVKG
ncbi:carbohydrate ABC transporter permease [Nocardioides zhouii]|uniref:Carbohydrate ABC transporter permease n=1 Tax=Nocardioides zhouii TaxID=1168729 RepID=A0A4Q2SYA3_9ACTN|nr:carbohydrate ABC transporter permease [Nocardioides zhouii]RYC09554.1 carbohydrate ABC transporter permease [Nocardioides zhouii]